MTPRKALISALVVAGVAGLALIAEIKAEATGEIKAEPLLVNDLAGEPDKEVNIQLYSFPPGASVPWHIHPDAHEFGYQLDGELTLLTNGELEDAEGRRSLLCRAERHSSGDQCEPHASREDRRREGEAQGQAGVDRSAALAVASA